MDTRLCWMRTSSQYFVYALKDWTTVVLSVLLVAVVPKRLGRSCTVLLPTCRIWHEASAVCYWCINFLCFIIIHYKPYISYRFYTLWSITISVSYAELNSSWKLQNILPNGTQRNTLNRDLLIIIDETFNLVEVRSKPAACFEVDDCLVFGCDVGHLHNTILPVVIDYSINYKSCSSNYYYYYY